MGILQWNQDNQEAAFRAIDAFRAKQPIQPGDAQALKTRFYVFLLLGVFLGNVVAFAYRGHQEDVIDYMCSNNYTDELTCLVVRSQLACPTCTLSLIQFSCPENTSKMCVAVIYNYSNKPRSWNGT
jgi:hypothetical protein